MNFVINFFYLLDRRDGQKFQAEIEQSFKKLSDFSAALVKHKKRGQSLLESVDSAKRFFNLQLRDATVVEDVSFIIF